MPPPARPRRTRTSEPSGATAVRSRGRRVVVNGVMALSVARVGTTDRICRRRRARGKVPRSSAGGIPTPRWPWHSPPRWPSSPPPSTLPSREERMTETASEIVWRPTREYAERTRISRFMRSLGVGSLEELQRRSNADPDWYWDAVVRDLGLRFSRPYTRVRDVSRGVPWPRWFEGGLMNFADNCVDRHVDAGRGEQPALIWEGDDGRTRTLTYHELAREVNQLANALKRLGVGEGDRVGVFLPMSLEAAIATLAIVRIGAIYTPCFSGYGAQAVASRLQDCEAKALVTADGFYRRGQIVKMKETADEAVAASPSIQHVIVYKRLGRDIPWARGRDSGWPELTGSV